MKRAYQVQPPNYEESVKAKEFLAFLRQHGIITQEGEKDRLSRLDFGADAKTVKERLHVGVRLLISKSRKENRMADREEFIDLLVTQAAFFMASQLNEVEKLTRKITEFLEQEEHKVRGTPIEGENMEIDFYVHGRATSLPPVRRSSTMMMGIEKATVPMVYGTPEPRPPVPQERPYKVTPLAKNDANVVNVGEAAGTSDDSLPKKLAQLERALTYVAHRASNSDIEQVVGYAALCMSVVDGSSLGSTIINLNANVFPYLARLQKKGGLAYLFSQRTVLGDIDKLIDHYGNIERRLQRIEWCLTGLSLALSLFAVYHFRKR